MPFMLRIKCNLYEIHYVGNTQFSTFKQIQHNYYWALNIVRKNRVRSVSNWLDQGTDGLPTGQRTSVLPRAQTVSAALVLHAALLSVPLYCPSTSSGWTVLRLAPLVLRCTWWISAISCYLRISSAVNQLTRTVVSQWLLS